MSIAREVKTCPMVDKPEPLKTQLWKGLCAPEQLPYQWL